MQSPFTLLASMAQPSSSSSSRKQSPTLSSPLHFPLTSSPGPIPPSFISRRSRTASPASSAASSSSTTTSGFFGRRISSDSDMSFSSRYSPVFEEDLPSLSRSNSSCSSCSSSTGSISNKLDLSTPEGRSSYLTAPKILPSPSPSSFSDTYSISPRSSSSFTRPPLKRRDTPIPSHSSLPSTGEPLPKPSQSFTTNLTTEPIPSVTRAAVRPALKRKDTPRPASSSDEDLLGLGLTFAFDFNMDFVKHQSRKGWGEGKQERRFSSVIDGKVWVPAGI